MNRRNFITTGAAAGAASLAACSPSTEAAKNETAPAQAAAKPITMHVGCQSGPTDAQRLQFFKRHGVNHICGNPPRPEGRGHWTVEEIVKFRELCEQHGVELSMVPLPFLSSSHIDREKRGAIMLGQSPERDRDIEDVHKVIEACAKAGVPSFKYNMSLLGVVRTERTPGRGGSTYSTWRLAEAKPEPPLTRAGVVNADAFWERITYFLDRVIPVANELKVRAACHPHDPGMPPEGYQGIDRVLGTPEGLYKFMKIQESPYHGFNLCLGTTAEMLQDPNREIHDVIRTIGSAKKIFNIHFRNIRGKRDSFSETYPDEGDMNMVHVAQTLREVEYPYMLMPDHVPQHPDDPRGSQGFAFAYGYIKAILQTLETVG
jgi:mannonate dehydratase